eukprot:TRINITY_DN67810_c5_g1_i1.p1 TRINITY_DN67810_c5_g1~~TRINITY_DN67810_c5_g1_i1.p1  ORF type:complete len:319 (+),score=37.73 TRINITY_DN67810_c5_g1_i1:233-1189(+)
MSQRKISAFFAPKRKPEDDGNEEAKKAKPEPEKAKVQPTGTLSLAMPSATTGVSSSSSSTKQVQNPTNGGNGDDNSNAAVDSEFYNTAVGSLDPTWKAALAKELNGAHFLSICKKIDQQKKAGKAVLPPSHEVFTALNLTPLNKVKAVILGQDPYFKPGQAHGLSFSVKPGVAIPQSLHRIYAELGRDIPGFTKPKHGNLISWANEGVLMLNATLTVESGTANSHKDFGWQQFTDKVIQKINQEADGVVFLLWGKFAEKKASLVDKKKHGVIISAHPSPMAGEAWVNNKCFSKANEWLESRGTSPINWKLSMQPTLES